MKKMLQKSIYWFSKISKMTLLVFCLIIVHYGFQEMLAIGFGTGLQAVSMCVAAAALGLFAVGPIVGILGILEDIKEGV